MCTSQQPGAGADSATRYRVTLIDSEHDRAGGYDMFVTASSPEMAESIARNRAYEDGAEAVVVLGYLAS